MFEQFMIVWGGQSSVLDDARTDPLLIAVNDTNY